MASIRKPLQGITNIIRFNWHFYAFAIVVIAAMLTISLQLDGFIGQVVRIAAVLTLITTSLSLVVSFYVYDASGFYDLKWLAHDDNNQLIVNINAGFDETSELLANRFPNASLQVFDFYDPKKHTEISIKRARKVFQMFRNTQAISTDKLPIENEVADKIILCLAAHEIRKSMERILFLKNCEGY